MLLAIAAGVGWGLAIGLSVALTVALWPRRPGVEPSPGKEQRADVRDFPSFGEKRA